MGAPLPSHIFTNHSRHREYVFAYIHEILQAKIKIAASKTKIYLLQVIHIARMYPNFTLYYKYIHIFKETCHFLEDILISTHSTGRDKLSINT